MFSDPQPAQALCPFLCSSLSFDNNYFLSLLSIILLVKESTGFFQICHREDITRYNKPSTTTKQTIPRIFSFCWTTSGQSPRYHMKKFPHVGLDTGATALKWRIYSNTFLSPAQPCCLFWFLSPVPQVCESSALRQRSSRLLPLIIPFQILAGLHFALSL